MENGTVSLQNHTWRTDMHCIKGKTRFQCNGRTRSGEDWVTGLTLNDKAKCQIVHRHKNLQMNNKSRWRKEINKKTTKHALQNAPPPLNLSGRLFILHTTLFQDDLSSCRTCKLASLEQSQNQGNRGDLSPLLNMNSTASFWLQQILFFYLMSSRSIFAMSSRCLPMPSAHFFAEWARKTDDQKSPFPLKASSHQGIRYLICISDLACWYETRSANLSTNPFSRYWSTIISREASTSVTQISDRTT